MKKRERIFWGSWLLLGVLTLAFYAVRRNKSVVDWMLERLCIPIREGMGAVTACLPFSVAELLYTLIVLLALWGLLSLWPAVKRSAHKGKTLLLHLGALALIPAVMVTGYNWLWALGYYGSSFSEKSGLSNEGVTVEELTQVTAYFATQASLYSRQVQRDEQGHFAEADFWQDYQGLYTALEEEFPCLKNRELRPKPMVYSKFMSLLGFSGFYFPFTGEANVNVDFPPALQPETIAHELAHQRRVASEAEANFVGIAAAVSSGKTVYQYSGYLSGLTHLSNALYRADPQAWAEISQGLTEEIRIDWQDNNAYWAQFESPVETVATAVYDGYLKHNDQSLGMKSYGACVDLLVEYYGEQGK